MMNISIFDKRLKITNLRLRPHLAGASELKSFIIQGKGLFFTHCQNLCHWWSGDKFRKTRHQQTILFLYLSVPAKHPPLASHFAKHEINMHFASVNWIIIYLCTCLSQVITWTNDDLFAIESLWTKIREILMKTSKLAGWVVSYNLACILLFTFKYGHGLWGQG